MQPSEIFEYNFCVYASRDPNVLFSFNFASVVRSVYVTARGKEKGGKKWSVLSTKNGDVSEIGRKVLTERAR